MTPEEQIKAGELMIAHAKGECEVEFRIDGADHWGFAPKPRWDWHDFEYRARPLSLRERVEGLHVTHLAGPLTQYVLKSDVLALIDEENESD